MNDILLNSMTNSCSKQSYVQVFDYKSISFKTYVNMFERMEIVESIYKGVVEPSYKKPTQADSKCAGHSSNNRG